MRQGHGRDVPYMPGFNTIDQLVKFYTPHGGYITAGNHEDRYFIVRLPMQKRIHFYEMALSGNTPYHAKFRSQGFYDQHSPYYLGPEIEKGLRIGHLRPDGCYMLPEYEPAGIYFGVDMAKDNGYQTTFWRIIFPDQTWIRVANGQEADRYIASHLKEHLSNEDSKTQVGGD